MGKRVEVVASGEVQGVGYRGPVARFARGLGMTGYIRNQADGTVKIVAEGDAERLKRFLRVIVIREPPINVEKIVTKERSPTGRDRLFRIRSGSLVEEIQEGLGAGEEQLRMLRKDFSDYRGEFRDYRANSGVSPRGRTRISRRSMRDTARSLRSWPGSWRRWRRSRRRRGKN